MTQSTADTLSRLRDAVAGLPSGPKLIAALEQAANPSAAPVELIASVVAEAKAHRSAENGGAAPPARMDLAGANSLVPALQFISPRGKQDLAFFADRFVVKTAKNDVVVPYAAVEHIIILDAIPRDTKGRVLLYLHLAKGAGVVNGKKALTAVVIQVTASQELDVAHPTAPGAPRLSGAAAVVLCQAFGAALSPANVFAAPNAAVFTSAEGAAGVGAHVKASAGNLFPLPAGLCFLETPATFIPLPAIASVELARAGGASTTFDLYVHLRDGTTQEFSQISRHEVGAVEGYARAAGLALGPPADSASEEEGGEGAGSEASDTDDPDDEDFNPLGDSDEEGVGGKKKKKRGGAGGEGRPAKKARAEEEGAEGAAAKGEGAEAEDDGEEEEEEEEEAESGDSDEDSDDDSDSDSDGSVEMVSEDEFSMGALRSMMEEEKGGKKGGKAGGGGDAGA